MVAFVNLPNELVEFIQQWKNKKGSLVMILHTVQDFYGYVPKNICFALSKELNIPIARIYEVLTFYNYFRLEMPAKYKIAVCMGTACYLKGAASLLETIMNNLNITEGKITEDGLFGLERVRCLGCCSLAPVVSVNGKIFAKVNEQSLLKILDDYKQQG